MFTDWLTLVPRQGPLQSVTRGPWSRDVKPFQSYGHTFHPIWLAPSVVCVYACRFAEGHGMHRRPPHMPRIDRLYERLITGTPWFFTCVVRSRLGLWFSLVDISRKFAEALLSCWRCLSVMFSYAHFLCSTKVGAIVILG
jgi:hypothetical protein